MKNQARKIHCKDGTRLSVQASQYHYCTPRADEGPYTRVEVGFPSITPPDSWREYCDGHWSEATNTVFAFIPVGLVEEFIASHGGIDIGATL